MLLCVGEHQCSMRCGRQLSSLPDTAQVYAAQAPALDALATWLVEDTARLEPRLLGRDVTNRFVALLAAYTPCCEFLSASWQSCRDQDAMSHDIRWAGNALTPLPSRLAVDQQSGAKVLFSKLRHRATGSVAIMERVAVLRSAG